MGVAVGKTIVVAVAVGVGGASVGGIAIGVRVSSIAVCVSVGRIAAVVGTAAIAVAAAIGGEDGGALFAIGRNSAHPVTNKERSLEFFTVILNDTAGTAVPATANVADKFPGVTVGVIDYAYDNFMLQVTPCRPWFQAV